MQSELIEKLDPVQDEVLLTATILIIEDDESQREVLAHSLTRQGFETLEAGTAQEGVRLAEIHAPDLVLLDVRLPDLDGFEVCQSLDDSPVTGRIPVIMLSGMERPDVIRRARSAGCHYFVRKPYDPNALLILIEQALVDSRGGMI